MIAFGFVNITVVFYIDWVQSRNVVLLRVSGGGNCHTGHQSGILQTLLKLYLMLCGNIFTSPGFFATYIVLWDEIWFQKFDGNLQKRNYDYCYSFIMILINAILKEIRYLNAM